MRAGGGRRRFGAPSIIAGGGDEVDGKNEDDAGWCFGIRAQTFRQDPLAGEAWSFSDQFRVSSPAVLMIVTQFEGQSPVSVTTPELLAC